jgi:hypothetical protein
MKKEGIILIVILVVVVGAYFLLKKRKPVMLPAPPVILQQPESNQGKLIDLGGSLLNKIIPGNSSDGSFESYFENSIP